jgi:hypothetical protein
MTTPKRFRGFTRLGLLTREDGTDMLSRHLGKQLPHDAAEYPKRAQISSTSRRKPQIKVRTGTSSPFHLIVFVSITGSPETRRAFCLNLSKVNVSGRMNGHHIQYILTLPGNSVSLLCAEN